MDFRCGIVGLRPRPEATLANLFKPSVSNRARHDRTVIAVTPTLDAIWVFATPSAASSNALARSTSRCAAVRETERAFSTSR